MARSGPLLTEAQWKKIAPLLPKPPKQRNGGRPWIQNRRVLEGILWILRSGARWQDLPEKFPHPSAFVHLYAGEEARSRRRLPRISGRGTTSRAPIAATATASPRAATRS